MSDLETLDARSKKTVDLLEEIRDLLKRMNAREQRDSKRRKQMKENINAMTEGYMQKYVEQVKQVADTFADRTQPIRQQDWREPSFCTPEDHFTPGPGPDSTTYYDKPKKDEPEV